MGTPLFWACRDKEVPSTHMIKDSVSITLTQFVSEGERVENEQGRRER